MLSRMKKIGIPGFRLQWMVPYTAHTCFVNPCARTIDHSSSGIPARTEIGRRLFNG